MKIPEASKDITKVGILFPSSKTSYMEENTQKDEETGGYAQEITLVLPGNVVICLGHWSCTLGMKFLLLLPMHVGSGSELFFPLFSGTSPVFHPKTS